MLTAPGHPSVAAAPSTHRRTHPPPTHPTHALKDDANDAADAGVRIHAQQRLPVLPVCHRPVGLAARQDGVLAVGLQLGVVGTPVDQAQSL